MSFLDFTIIQFRPFYGSLSILHGHKSSDRLPVALEAGRGMTVQPKIRGFDNTSPYSGAAKCYAGS
jgi:hypothetical protein